MVFDLSRTRPEKFTFYEPEPTGLAPGFVHDFCVISRPLSLADILTP